jgi:hypothetical protein
MSVALYLDHNANPVVATVLRHQEVDCITAREDGRAALDDESLLERVTNLGRVLYTEDDDFLGISARWQRQGRPFSGIAYAKQRRLSIGELIMQLQLIALASEPGDWRNALRHLPL